MPAEPRSRVWVLVGTRPEALKQAPVYLALREALGADRVRLIGTGQHRELLEQALANFGLSLDEDLHTMEPHQTPISTSAAILGRLEPLLERDRPEWIVVQGDTTSAAMAAWAGFHAGARIAHNEAGLRTYDLAQPFPEEANRKLIAVVAELHFAPTERAREALLAEGVPDRAIHVTGNPGIDALRVTLAQPAPPRIDELTGAVRSAGRELVLMTAHRRENQGPGMEEWFATLAAFLGEHPELELVYPMHPNRAGEAAARHHLRALGAVRIEEPFGYAETCHLLRHCRFVITDSGGIQEEAATLGVPVVVCRRATERPEAVDVGLAALAGTDAGPLSRALRWAHDRGTSDREEHFTPIFGDGHAADRIVRILSGEMR